jgi:polysaccharide biosynthesis/export protein
MKFAAFFVGALALVTSGCGGPQLTGRPGMSIVKGDELAMPSRSDLILAQRSYLVGPFDKISVDVYNVPELTRTVQVDASGKISLPLAGEIAAAGNTPTELAALIADRLRGRYVRNPQVTVNAETVNQTVTVDGQVRKPGLYPVTGRMTLVRAVATAEGTTEFAKSDFVVVFRRVDGKDLAALYNLRSIREGIYADPEIFANDVVFVGESTARKVFRDVVQTGAAVAGPLTILFSRL